MRNATWPLAVTHFGWLAHRDLVREWRSWTAWPAMVLLGVAIVLVLQLQLDVPPAVRGDLAGGLFWLATFLATAPSFDRLFTAERDQRTWDAIRLYSTAPAVVFVAKVAVQFVAMAALECILVPVFVVLSDARSMAAPLPLVGIAIVTNLGIAALGTVLGALAGGLTQRGGPLLLLLLPMAIPVLLAASEATRLVLQGNADGLAGRWIGLLSAFAAAFLVAGLLIFDYIVED